jgi:hypothetical protein
MTVSEPKRGRGTKIWRCENKSIPDKQAPQHDGSPECSRDELGVATKPEIRSAEKMLNIAAEDVSFVACAASPFGTNANTDPPSHFRIEYPLDTKLSFSQYLSPLLHELGHVYQAKGCRCWGKLSSQASMERTELGADFIAGFEARRLDLSPGLSQTSLDLVGSYKTGLRDPHGTPENRLEAFRYGYFYQPAETSVDSSYADFQDNLFSQIKHSGTLK